MAESTNDSLLSRLALAERPGLRMLALAVTIAAAAFLLWRGNEPPPPGSSSDARQLRGDAEPDGFVVNGRYTSYDTNGQRKVVFSSPRIEQFEEGGLAIMTSPSAELSGQTEGEPWIVNADKGHLRQSDDLLYLMGNVRVERMIGEREATLTTQSLTLDNQKGTAFTDDPVTITDNLGVTRAIGMKAWIDERILELNSQVEGRYETVN